MALTGSTNAEKIWNFCKSKGMTDCGCAGVLGNLDCESGLNPVNLEDQYQNKWGYTDVGYMEAVDSGAYINFVRDEAGWGLAQWTWWSRKQDLLNYARSCGVSIGDLEMQLNFLMKEFMEKFPGVLNTLRTATSVLQASNAMLLQFECPADQSSAMKNKRCAMSQTYYDRFGGGKMSDFVCTLTPINGYYFFKKGSRIQLSKNFWSYEFDCHGVGCCTETKINVKLVDFCQKIRDHFDRAITISSPYRCVIHNGGTKNAAAKSRHTMGDAADIVVAGVTPREVAKYAESIGIKGIGLYETSADGFFVHIDTRDVKSFWYGQAQAYRSTFGGSSNAVNVQTSSNTASAMTVLCYGNKGQAVKDLQEKLIKLGYSCGSCGADGSFGMGTLSAVKQFQKDSGFSIKEQDGVVGAVTMAAIDKKMATVSDKQTYTVTANLLNVRSGAGINNNVVATIAKGSTVVVTEEINGWGKINIGWVSMQYLQKG